MTDPLSPPTAGRAATIRDVARLAGVAPGTVSNVFTGRKPVAEPLRRAVLRAVDDLGYRPNQLASSLRMRQTRSIGVVVPDITNPFFASLIRQLERLATRDGFQILLMNSQEDEARDVERIRTLIARQIDGLLIAPSGNSVDARLDAAGAPPTLVVDRALESSAYDTVAVDNDRALEEGCRHLLDLGHRDVVLLATSEALSNIRDRAMGFRRAFHEAGCGSRGRVIFGGRTADSCRGALERELRRDRPTAVVCAAYAATLGAMQAIRAMDLDIPRDISLLGFDDADWMTALRPSISTVEQPIAAIAEAAWATLQARMSGSAPQGATHLRLPCTLRLRDSTRRL